MWGTPEAPNPIPLCITTPSRRVCSRHPLEALGWLGGDPGHKGLEIRDIIHGFLTGTGKCSPGSSQYRDSSGTGWDQPKFQGFSLCWPGLAWGSFPWLLRRGIQLFPGCRKGAGIAHLPSAQLCQPVLGGVSLAVLCCDLRATRGEGGQERFGFSFSWEFSAPDPCAALPAALRSLSLPSQGTVTRAGTAPPHPFLLPHGSGSCFHPFLCPHGSL